MRRRIVWFLAALFVAISVSAWAQDPGDPQLAALEAQVASQQQSINELTYSLYQLSVRVQMLELNICPYPEAPCVVPMGDGR